MWWIMRAKLAVIWRGPYSTEGTGLLPHLGSWQPPGVGAEDQDSQSTLLAQSPERAWDWGWGALKGSQLGSHAAFLGLGFPMLEGAWRSVVPGPRGGAFWGGRGPCPVSTKSGLRSAQPPSRASACQWRPWPWLPSSCCAHRSPGRPAAVAAPLPSGR